ncbi:MAG TPA: cytochrome c [Isosphaeraceae bacterium]|jgi:mono/diheme cytochrome c family protein|nr:cytochrome c [Isosphaeraceae bacterium]
MFRSRGQTDGLALGQRIVLLFLVLPGCRSEMYDQPRFEPYEATEFFDDGTSARPLVAGTVPRRDPREQGKSSDELFTTGKKAGQLADSLPFPVDSALLDRGQDRYRIFCTPCHGELGDGRGMIVQRGFNPPPSYHSEELRKKPVGHYFDVMTRGFGTMYSYASRISARDRWAIAAYIRALQLSQHATAGDLSPEDRGQLQGVGP